MPKVFFITIVSIFYFSLSLSPGLAQEPSDQVIDVLTKAKTTYQNQEYRRCISQLKQAIRLVQEMMVDKVKAVFPKPIKGWEEMGEASAGLQNTFSDKLSVRKMYLKSGTTASIEIEISMNRTRAANLRSWIANPMEMRSSSQRAELETIAGQRFISEFDGKTKHGEVVTVLGASTVVRIAGDTIKDLKAVRKFAEKLDYDSIREAMK